jgi:MFS family permease
MAYAALMAFIALYLVDARGLAPEWAAALFGVPQILGVLAAPGAGALSDRLGRKTVILIGIVGFGPSFYALTLVPNELIVLPLLSLGLFAALRMTTTETFVIDNAPPHRRASVLGSYHMLSQELGGLAAPLLGLLAGLVGIGLAFESLCLALLVLSLAVLPVRRRL